VSSFYDNDLFVTFSGQWICRCCSHSAFTMWKRGHIFHVVHTPPGERMCESGIEIEFCQNSARVLEIDIAKRSAREIPFWCQ
jgi:hypothetical protein